MEHGTPEPAGHAEVAEEAVVWHERVFCGQLAPERFEARVVHVAVEDGEKDGEGLLYAEEPFERPFSVELLDCLATYDAFGSYRTLAGIVTFGGTVPEEKTEVEGERNGGGGRAVLRATVLRGGGSAWCV